MKDIHNNPLFTEITEEEEVSVQGGNPVLIRAAIRFGLPAVRAAIQAAGRWLSQPGNGVILWDNKNTFGDGIRAGVGIASDRDVPGSARFGIKNNGRWETFNI